MATAAQTETTGKGGAPRGTRRRSKKTDGASLSAAEKEAQATIREAKEKQAATAKAAKEAEKAAEKAKAEAEAKRLKDKTIKSLERTAKDINGRFDAINRGEKRLDDHRLAAALNLAFAKERCREAKINFQDWTTENIKQSWETARKLLPIGVAEQENPGDGMKLLTDMREKNKEANKAARERKKAEAEAKRKEKEEEAKSPKGRSEVKGKVRQQMADLDKKDWEEVMEQEALAANKVLVDADEAEADAKMTAVERLQKSFKRLKAKGKLEFASWVAEQVGAKLVMEGEGEEGEE